MALEEKISEHLGKPYVYIKDQKKFLCSNGVLFTLEEYKNGIDINAEYERRAKEDMLYDYAYAKSTGLLRKKRGYSKMLVDSSPVEQTVENGALEKQNNEGIYKESFEKIAAENNSVPEQKKNDETVPKVSEDDTNGLQHKVPVHGRAGGDWRDTSEVRHEVEGRGQGEKQGFSVMFIVALLGFTSLISGYISTLHTATYLYDYVDVFSAWLMSASVTAYNATAFEVSVIFKSKRRFGLTFVFITLWTMVTLFSMATTVSVFYDRFNFTETQIALENKQSDSNKLALELLQKKEADLRESIEFKKKDIEYRQERDYATTAVRLELEALQKELQKNLSEQQQLLQETPEVTEKVTKRKESLFAFLGRLMKIEGGVLEFIMSTLSAIFVNLIAPLSLTAVTELLKKRTLD
jgi:hypothetical protein